MKKTFLSRMAPHMESMIAYKQALGYSVKT